MTHYTLNGKRPVKCDDIHAWAMWNKTADRRVARTEIGGVAISTVFLGLDHGFGGEVLLFETMVFGGPYDGATWRCETWPQAEAQHENVCRLVAGASEN